MLLTFAVIIIGTLFALRPLQKNVFFLLYFALMMGCAYAFELKGFYFDPFSKQSLLMFLLLHSVLINLVTMMAYASDKKAAKKGDWRVPEIQLHLLELLGGSPGAFLSQKLFHHKTKKKSFQLSFLFVFAVQIVIVYYVLKMLRII